MIWAYCYPGLPKTSKDVKTKIYKAMNGITIALEDRRYKTKGLAVSAN